MPTLYYNCPSGICGDMHLGAMIALGVDPARLESELRKLPYTGWKLVVAEDARQGISGTRCDVVIEPTHEHEHGHAHEHEHTHEHEPDSGHHHHHHHHRTFREIRDAITASTLSERVKTDAVACFRALAEAEGAVHGIDPESVHFHEVGAIDSIIDMVGAAICWDLLDIDRIVCGSLELGGGTVLCAHGRMPVPAPATARLIQGWPVSAGAIDKETTTPTGAALLRGKACEFSATMSGTILRTGIGIGQRDDPRLANALYLSLLDESPGSGTASAPAAAASGQGLETIIELAANLDDMSPEAVAHLTDKLRHAGAVDVWQTPAFFKKGRAGFVVHALAHVEAAAEVESAFFKHSRTLGVRRQHWSRRTLSRQTVPVETPWGSVRMKCASLPDGSSRVKAEHADLAELAEREDLPLAQIEKAAAEAYAAR